MERRPGEQRLKIDERQGRTPHEHGHARLPRPRDHYGRDHLHDPLPRHWQRPPRGQLHPLHQHHRQTGEGLRQQVPRVHEGDEPVLLPAHRQGDGPGAAPLVPPVDQIPDGADQGRQQTQAVDRRPEGHGAQEHAARPGARSAQGEKQQPAPQQQGRQQQRQQGPQKRSAVQEQGRGQQAARPPRQAQQPGPPAEGQQVPRRPHEGREGRPPRRHRRPAQGGGQPDQQPVHGEVVQQKPFQGDPHATSTAKMVMSSRWPRHLASAITASAMRSRGAAQPLLRASSRSFPSRS